MAAIAHSTSNNNMDTICIDTKRLLAVPQIPNDSTTLLQKPPMSDDLNVKFKAILPSIKDQFLRSVEISGGDDSADSDKQSKPIEYPKKYTLITVTDKDNISKSAVMIDDVESKEEVSRAQGDATTDKEDNDEYIERNLFRLRHGFAKEEFAQASQHNTSSTLNAVQGLTLIHRPHTGNFMALVEQLSAMRTAAAALQFDDVALFEGAVEKCERVFGHHQKFDQILDYEPSQGGAIRSLHEMVTACYQDTVEMIENWAVVYHTLQELIQRIGTIVAAGGACSSASLSAGVSVSGKSPKARKSLFSKKSAETALMCPIAPEALQHAKVVCANWADQMRTFEQLARAYRAFADQATEFALLREIEAIGRCCGEEFLSTLQRAQEAFQNTRQLSHLHYQIDYTNFNKTLPKDNALTTAEERKAHPLRTLFSRDMIGQCQLVRDGRLTEFVSPFVAAAAGSSKKKSATPPAPKEYQLIVASNTIYLCEVINAPAESQDASKGSNKKSGQIGNPLKQLRLVHEPVLVMDSQISSTPDVVHPPLIQKNMVMVCFYNQTSYILQADSCEERDAWVECARQLNIEQPKPTEACREQDENDEIKRSMSTASFKTTAGGKSKGTRVSLLKRLKTLGRSSNNLVGDMGPIPEIHPDQLTHTDEEEKARRMQLGQPSLWEVRRLPLDLGVIPPLEHPIPFRKSHLYDTNVKIEDLTTGKVAPGEFGMGIEDRAAYFRDECALFSVLRPARLIPFNDIDRKRDDFFLCCKRLHKGEVMYVEPPYITDFYARSWLHPDMHIEFDAECKSVTIAKMYRIICSTSEIVTEFQKYHGWLMRTARISPDNTFLCMDYRSHPLRIAKRIERAATAAGSNPSTVEDTKVLEAGRKHTELGECNIEFRRMSNAPYALSVGFYNPATKRDMAAGVMVFDKSKLKATASSLGLNALNALGPSNGVVRVSATEMSLTLWQTDAQTRPTFIKGQRVFETVKSKSLDMFKITGPREALDELEDFMRVKNGTDCKARDIGDTFHLVEMAFQDEALDSSEENKGTMEQQYNVWAMSSESTFDHRSDGLLDTVQEEDEEDEDGDQRRKRKQINKADVRAGSTDTFRFKNKSALSMMERHRQEDLAAAEADANRALDSCLPPIVPSLLENLAFDSALSDYIPEGEGPTAVSSIGDLTQMRAIADSTVVGLEPTSELEARLNAVKATVYHSAIALQATEEAQVQINADGVVLATRYLPKKTQCTDGLAVEDSNGDIEPGVDVEHHMPVKDLKKRWEEIYRHGV
ncbi:hypothetical protein EDD21DRAFT_422551 [Dissophora ornata]|nr:hypothetical protein BGZ58_000255 [Dissophora ornata]KAI8603869.1 hypothetical protein EDD21DRAFT_422551 [Dissophora ornata]